MQSSNINNDLYQSESYDLHGPSSSYYYKRIQQQNGQINLIDDECFVAAVYEHVRVDLPREVEKGIKINLDAYAEAARKASQNVSDLNHSLLCLQ